MTDTATKPRSTEVKVERVKAKVREQVIALLGKPDDLYRLDVHLYKNGRARTNVWRRFMERPEGKGGFMGSLGGSDLIEVTKITDSFYLHLSTTAIIESADPEIVRRY